MGSHTGSHGARGRTLMTILCFSYAKIRMAEMRPVGVSIEVLTPDQVALIEVIADSFEAYGGRDWELLATGLGLDIAGINRDAVRIRQGQVDRVDRMHFRMREKLLAIFSMFIANCWYLGVEIDLPVYLSQLLVNRRLFHYPYTSLSARLAYMFA